MRNPGRRSAQVDLVPPVAIDSRTRPPPPPEFSQDERRLWERTILSRRPLWFLGSEELLRTFCVESVACQKLEAAKRKLKPGGSKRYRAIAAEYRESSRHIASLSTKLKLTPSAMIQRNVSADGDKPVSINGYGYQPPVDRAPDGAAALVDEYGQRSFEKLRQSLEARDYPAGQSD